MALFSTNINCKTVSNDPIFPTAINYVDAVYKLCKWACKIPVQTLKRKEPPGFVEDLM